MYAAEVVTKKETSPHCRPAVKDTAVEKDTASDKNEDLCKFWRARERNRKALARPI